LFIAIISIGLVLVAPEIIWILGGDKYAEGIWVVAPVSASIYFQFLYAMYGNIEFYYEENLFIMFASIGAAGLNIVLNYIFIKLYGFVAAGYTTLVCYVLYAFFHYKFSSYVLKKHTGGMKHLYNDKFVLLCAVAVIVLSLLLMSLYNYPVIRYLVVAGILVAMFICRKRIKNILQKIRK
jgi:O-antigen/teichoic acid export membrane protein